MSLRPTISAFELTKMRALFGCKDDGVANAVNKWIRTKGHARDRFQKSRPQMAMHCDGGADDLMCATIELTRRLGPFSFSDLGVCGVLAVHAPCFDRSHAWLRHNADPIHSAGVKYSPMNLVKDDFFICALCDADLLAMWTFDQDV